MDYVLSKVYYYEAHRMYTHNVQHKDICRNNRIDIYRNNDTIKPLMFKVQNTTLEF